MERCSCFDRGYAFSNSYFVFSGINPRPDGRGYSEAVEAIRALLAEERDIRTLISNESLSRFGLLAEGRRVSLSKGVPIPKPASSKGKKLAESSSRHTPDAQEEGEIKESEAPETQGENECGSYSVSAGRSA